MPSATETVQSKGGQGNGKILKGQHLYDAKPRVESVTVTFATVRDPGPLFNSPLIADFDGEVLGQNSMALNKTNIKRLVSVLGDDYSKWTGAVCTVERMRVTNPSTSALAWGLVITTVKAKGQRKAVNVEVGISDDDVPF